MSDSTTWGGMDVHKENIVTVSFGDSHDPLGETPNAAKGKELLAGRIAGLGKGNGVRLR